MTGNTLIEMLPVLIVVLVVFIVIVSIIVIAVRKQKEKNIKLREQGFLEKGAKGNGTFQGVEYSYVHFQGGKNAPPYFKVFVECPSTGDFKITRETGFDRFFKRLGICVELETNDREFDDAFFITTNSEGFTREYFRKSDKRRLVTEVFARGFNELIHDGEKIVATWKSFPRGMNMEIKTIEEIAAVLGQLAGDIPNIYEQESAENIGWKQRRFFAFAVPIFLLVAGIAGLVMGLTTFHPLDEGKVILDSFKYSIPLLILFLWFSVQLLRGRSSSHRELMGVFALSLFGFIIAGMGGEMTLNGWLDKSKPVIHEVKVTDKYSTRSKNSRSYHVVLESWREGRYSEKLSVRRSFYNQLVPGQSTMVITTKAGKLGFEWLVEYQ
ncbi:MAG: hypothetical protein QG657_2325 [Acidobacteriota bacterium]|nr:hypothetical protein [Acidobacteriota bacterium]